MGVIEGEWKGREVEVVLGLVVFRSGSVSVYFGYLDFFRVCNFICGGFAGG